MKKLVVIEDETFVINGIQAILKRIRSDIVLCGSATDGLSGFDLLMDTRPDIILTDIRMPGMDGLSLIESIKPYLPNSVFIVISGYQEFEYARRALTLGVLGYLDKPITIPKVRLILDRAVEQLDYQNQNKLDTDQAFDEQIDMLISVIRGGDVQDIINCKSDLLSFLSRISDLKTLKLWVYRAACIATSVFFSDSPAGNASEKYFPSHAHLESLEDGRQVIDYLETILNRIVDELQLRAHNQECVPVAQILSYIDQHYNQDIGLCELADLVHMNPSYLSSLFKEKVGVSFVKYLTGLRIEKAKALLRDGGKVTRVCEQVGYHNYRYFCDLFKRIVGCTPGEYRSNG